MAAMIGEKRTEALAPDATVSRMLLFTDTTSDLASEVRDRKVPASWLDDAWAVLDRVEASGKELDDSDKARVAKARGDILVAKGETARNDRTVSSYYLECVEEDPLSQVNDGKKGGPCFEALEPADQIAACRSLRNALFRWDRSEQALVQHFTYIMSVCIGAARKIKPDGDITGDDLGWATAAQDLEVYVKITSGDSPSIPSGGDDDGSPRRKGKYEVCSTTSECQNGLVCRKRSYNDATGQCKGGALD